MGPIRAAFLTLIGAAITALTLWMLSRSPGSPLDAENATTLGGAIFFGCCTLVGLSQLFGAGIPDAAPDGSISIANSKLRAGLILLACIGFAGGAVLMQPILADARNPFARYVIYIIVPGALLAALFYLRQIFSSAPAYRLDAEALTIGKRKIPWREITGFSTLAVRGAKHLMVEVTQSYRATLGAMDKLATMTGITVGTGATGVRPDALKQVITTYWERARA